MGMSYQFIHTTSALQQCYRLSYWWSRTEIRYEDAIFRTKKWNRRECYGNLIEKEQFINWSTYALWRFLFFVLFLTWLSLSHPVRVPPPWERDRENRSRDCRGKDKNVTALKIVEWNKIHRLAVRRGNIHDSSCHLAPVWERERVGESVRERVRERERVGSGLG